MRALWTLAFLLAPCLAAAEEPAPMQGPDFTTYQFPQPAQPEEPPAPPAEQVVAGLSSDDIAISTSFDGSEIIIYGAIKRETPIPEGAPLQVIATVEGPSRSVTVRRKERRFGIWVNTQSVNVGAAPSFYAVSSTAPLADILDPAEDTQFRISIPLALRAFARPVEVDNPAEFTEALLRQRIAEGIYRLDEGGAYLAEQTLFRADFRLPANLVEGSYRVRIFLLRGGEVIDAYRAPLEVRKVGLERWLYRMAYDQPFLYGLMSLAIAALAGWAASAAFRSLQRR
ncbi:MAG: TIGR02186 family protein [Paracoccus sp. (in: a-proteobacteria)]|nr:TIGR02186 family protein [Paracoccus sp. (in: a-proteobacteria)]